MVTIDFQPDPATVAQDSAFDIRVLDAGVLQETFFILPVRFAVNDSELLQSVTRGSSDPESPWLPLPLLHMTSVGVDCIRMAAEDGTADLDLPGSGWRVQITVADGIASLRSFVNGRVVTVDYEEVRKAAAGFRRSGASYLLDQAPVIGTHPYWGPWLRAAVRKDLESGL